jgi:hypothetical protein
MLPSQSPLFCCSFAAPNGIPLALSETAIIPAPDFSGLAPESLRRLLVLFGCMGPGFVLPRHIKKLKNRGYF